MPLPDKDKRVGKPWVFKQTGTPPFKTLTLAGGSAPHGRPRKTPIVQHGVKIRHTTTRYPGNDGEPTRHVFGMELHPWELTGRFMDSDGGLGYAQQMTAYVRAFVIDSKPVTITWGDALSVKGFIDEFLPAYEGVADVAWKLNIEVDEDALAPSRFPQPQLPQPRAYVTSMDEAFLGLFETYRGKNVRQARDFFSLSLLEPLESLVGTVGSAFANVTNIANGIDSFERATTGEVKRLRAVVSQLKTAVLSMQGTFENTKIHGDQIGQPLPLFSSGTSSAQTTGADWMSATADIEQQRYLAESSVRMTKVLALLAEMDLRAQIAERGQVKRTYVAQLGDTWERISTRAFGAPDAANAIMDANGIRGGTRPEPGRSYSIPKP